MSQASQILIIDDDWGTCEMVSDVLRLKGYSVETAGLGQEGLEMLRSRPFDAAIVDIKLPDISGVDLLRVMKEVSPGIEVILITGHASLKSAIQAINSNAFAYLTKPFEINHLIATLDNALEKQRLAMENRRLYQEVLQELAERTRTEEELRESEIPFRSVVESANDAIILSDGSGKIVSWNKAAQIIFGYGKEEVLDKPLTVLMPERYRDAHQKALERVRSTGFAHVIGKTVEFHGLRKDGSEFPLEISLTTWKKGRETFYSGIIRDITERKLAEDQIERHRQHLAALHEIDLAITSTLDLRTILNVLLEKIDLLLPYSVTTLRLLNKESGLLEAVASRNIDEEEWKSTMREGGRGFSKGALKNKGPVIIANVQKNTHSQYPEFLRKYGLISYLGVPLIAKGNILGTLGFYTKEEHQFSNEEIDFLTMLAGQAAIAIHNSQLFEQVEKRTHELAALHAVAAAASESLHVDTVLQEVIKKITQIFHFDATRIFLFNPQMDELHLRASYETDPKFIAGLTAFRRGQGVVGSVAHTGEALVFEDVMSDPRYHAVSHSKLSQKGGFSFFAAFPINVKKSLIGVLACVGKDARHLTPDEIRLLTSIAHQIAVAVENATLFQETVTKAKELSALYSVATVVSQSLDLQAILHSVMEKTIEIFEFDVARIYLFDDDKKQLRLFSHTGLPNDIICHSIHKPSEGITGRVFDTGKPLLFTDIQNDPEFHKLVRDRAILNAGFRGHFSIPIGIKGKIAGVMNLVSKAPHHFSPGENQLIHSIVNHVGMAIENAMLYEQSKKQAVELEKDIAERKRVEVQLKRANAELAKREKALRETLSDLKEAHEELKATQLQLIQAEKLESVGRLAAGVAHEVKNPLAIILQGINYLSRHLPTDGDNVAMALQDMDNAVNRANSVVRGLLDFPAAAESSLNTEELNSVVEQSLLLVRYELARYHVNVVRELGAHLPPIRLDRNKMEQVFVNIFLNAIHAMPKGGTLTVKTYAKQLTKVDHNVGSRKADHLRIGETVVMVEVEDTGTGIPNDQLAEIFDPFFTTKSTGKGTGLGLTVTKKIIDLHGGTINIRNRKEGGVRATIMFKAREGNEHEEETDPAH